MIKDMTKKLNRLAAPWRLAAALLLLGAGTAGAHVIAVQPVAVVIAPPASVAPGALIAPDIHVFDEVQDRFLPVDVGVNAQPVVQVQGPGQLNPGIIPAGTCVRSHYIHYEPGMAAVATGGAEFDADILGVAVLQAQLDNSNFLGAPGTAYPTAAACAMLGNDCGLELTTLDAFRLDLSRIQVQFEAAQPGDRIRVITRGNIARCWQHQQDGAQD